MGGIVTVPKSAPNEETAPLWRTCGDESEQQKHKVVHLDPCLPPLEDKDHIRLYEILTEPVTQRAIGAFAVSKKNEYLLMCWAELEEFKEEDIEELRQNMMAEIYDAYIKPGSITQIKGLTEELTNTFTLELSTEFPTLAIGGFAEV
jgi:hypothetical protein